MTPKRTLLGTESGLASRQRVYEAEDAIIVEATDQYELTRKSVLFEDVVLVTYHREMGWLYVVVLSVIALIFLAVAGTIYAADGPPLAAGIVAGVASPFLILVVVRLILKVDVVTIFGRRSRAAVHFQFRKQQARELYGRICFRTRQAQRVPEEEVIPTQSVE